ncbi:unnamed protein product [Protopolystoma xenopodis]|uniref:Matrin-type domain-containing protein n=1 Tax=Protopolystoma xenopodis TaxID=117903 RepID=A0A3S4ZGQ6_9PLAT|nr:unnamed protein product [Protopolystoma xenopodis]
MRKGINPVDHRRKWDRNYYEKIADERFSSEIEALRNSRKEREVVKRDFLRPRDFSVDLESNVNRSQVISKTGPGSSQAGYYCEVCDCVVKDSINYLDHINGKKHQRNLGMSMRVKRSTLEEVKDRFSLHNRRREEKVDEYSLEERLRQIAEEEEKTKAYRREKKKERKRKSDEVDIEKDEELSFVMGFGGVPS